MNSPVPARQALVASLRREVGRLEAGHSPEDERSISTGSPALDRLLPAGGLRRGTLVEYLTSAAGSGAGTLALAAAREACRQGRAFVVLDCQRRFYPPAAAAFGIDLSAMLVLRPSNEADALWALDQALRCPGVGAVWTTWDRLDVRDYRRLQLAAECGGTLGLLMRPARQRGQPTWADIQWEVGNGRTLEAQCSAPSRPVAKVHSAPRPTIRVRARLMRPTWQLRVELARCRGGANGQVVFLELDETAGAWREVIDHAAHSLPLPASVAPATAARRA